MDSSGLKKYINKNNLILVVPIIVLIIFVILIFSVPPYSEQTVNFDGFSVPLPSNAQYADTSNGVKITGPQKEYVSEIFKTDDPNLLYEEVLNEMHQEGYDPIVEEYNSTHSVVRMQVDVAVPSDQDLAYYFYLFIVPKDSYDNVNFEFKDKNVTAWVIKAADFDFYVNLENNVKFGG